MTEICEREKPKIRVKIVDAIINKEDLIQKEYTLHDIQQVTKNIDSTIKFLASVGLLHNSVVCCTQHMTFVTRKQCSDGKVWHCSVCRSYRSIRNDSFFSKSSIRLTRHLELIYWWTSIESTQSVVMNQVGLGSEAIVNWYNYFRDVCAMWCIDHPTKIGGEGVKVDIAESKFMHRQYHRGHYKEGHLILGMVERHSLNSVLVPVPDQSGATLLPIILEHVLPGTCIVTDGCHSYEKLQESAGHNLQFMDPKDEKLNRNKIEGTWNNVKNRYKHLYGLSDNLFSTYLQEFSWRRVHKDNTFMSFIYWVRHYYPV
ncbi:Hypothetical predicted protein [Octopus vulgaris]|uniref:Uncharacterized protein n=2 Tax=Octopus TaxID=6643 RepID=A0AA36BBE2_OCTVU|nr:uncharacterized protein LOC115217914 [Octopus sinensis]CAI9731350.1 Hypothetical predicted protein [Octopus vulgaris]